MKKNLLPYASSIACKFTLISAMVCRFIMLDWQPYTLPHNSRADHAPATIGTGMFVFYSLQWGIIRIHTHGIKIKNVLIPFATLGCGHGNTPKSPLKWPRYHPMAREVKTDSHPCKNFGLRVKDVYSKLIQNMYRFVITFFLLFFRFHSSKVCGSERRRVGQRIHKGRSNNNDNNGNKEWWLIIIIINRIKTTRNAFNLTSQHVFKAEANSVLTLASSWFVFFVCWFLP